MKKQIGIKRIGKYIFLIIIISLINTVAFAQTTSQQLKEFQDILTGWAKYMGAAVAFWGAIQMGLAFKDDNPSSKEKGLRILIAGFMVAGIGTILDSGFFNA